MSAERSIWNKLRESHLKESENCDECGPFTHEEETEGPEDLLKEDWRSGTFSIADADRYCKETLEKVGLILFSIQSLEEKYASSPEILRKLHKLRAEIKSKF